MLGGGGWQPFLGNGDPSTPSRVRRCQHSLVAIRYPEFNPDLIPLCLSFPNCQLEITMPTSSGCCEN